MDPYYQQQQQQQPSGQAQPQQQPGMIQQGNQPQAQHQQAMQQQNVAGGYHNQRQDFGPGSVVAAGGGPQMVGPPQQTHPQHQHLQHQQQQQQPLQPQQQQQSSSGGGHHRSHQQPYNQQQQQAYLDSGQQQQTHGGGGRHSSSHYHGGQAPLPPQQQHHSSSSGGRYGPSHRSAMMHQHRSSAAAISDPMMTGGITDQLASASGPLTGSGSALNQLGGYYANRSAANQLDAAGYGQQQQQPDPTSGYHLGGGAHQHQSRYDSHYNPSSRRHYSHNLQHQQQQPGHPYDPLLMNDPLLVRPSAGGDPPVGPAGARYLSQPTGALHQSLANLPSASGKYAGYGDSTTMNPSERAYYGLDSAAGLGGPQASIRAGSMPPLTSMSDHYNPAAHGVGPLVDDPLLMGGGGQFGVGPAFGGQLNSSSSTYVQELRARLAEIQANFVSVKRELETATQKLGSTMHSIKTFWSPELKKERALRKEEATKYALINDQMKLMRIEVQVSFCCSYLLLSLSPLSNTAIILLSGRRKLSQGHSELTHLLRTFGDSPRGEGGHVVAAADPVGYWCFGRVPAAAAGNEAEPTAGGDGGLLECALSRGRKARIFELCE